MHMSDFEHQLNAYKENLHPTSMKLIYANGENEIDYISRSLVLLVDSEINLKQLLEIYAVTKSMMKFNNPYFPYETYSIILKKYGDVIDRFDIILILSFIRVGSAGNFNTLSDEEKYMIYKDAYDLIRKFEIIDMNTQGDVMTGAYGQFGYEITNPIPVRGFFGIKEYFDKLCSIDGEKVKFERIGSFSSQNIKERVDGYRISCQSQREILLYISVYNNRTSKKSPEGFILV